MLFWFLGGCGWVFFFSTFNVFPPGTGLSFLLPDLPQVGTYFFLLPLDDLNTSCPLFTLNCPFAQPTPLFFLPRLHRNKWSLTPYFSILKETSRLSLSSKPSPLLSSRTANDSSLLFLPSRSEHGNRGLIPLPTFLLAPPLFHVKPQATAPIPLPPNERICIVHPKRGS